VPVQLVLATDALVSPGGSETYLLTVAENLVRLGHDVTIHACSAGPVSELALAFGARVAVEDELPETCDGLLVQDVGMAYALAERWPELPQVVVAHSPLFDFQLPPLVPVPGSVVVVMSDRVQRRVEAMAGEFDIVRLRQPIDTLRLAPRGAPADRPRRALLLGNYLQGQSRSAIVEAWSAAGVEVVQVGTLTTPMLDPAGAIAEADIVVGKGRAVLDGMACGRPAFVYDAFGSDGWVTGRSYAELEADGFAGQSNPAAPGAEHLRAALESYDPDMGRVNRELVVKHHQDRKHAEALVALLRRASPSAGRGPTSSKELARVSRLRWRADSENFLLRSQADQLTGRLQEAMEREQVALARAHAAEDALAKAHRRRRRQARARRAAERRLEELTNGRRVRRGLGSVWGRSR
jgi:hypothetical protein